MKSGRRLDTVVKQALQKWYSSADFGCLRDLLEFRLVDGQLLPLGMTCFTVLDNAHVSRTQRLHSGCLWHCFAP